MNHVSKEHSLLGKGALGKPLSQAKRTHVQCAPVCDPKGSSAASASCAVLVVLANDTDLVVGRVWSAAREGGGRV